MSPYRKPTQPSKGWPHHQGLCPLLFLNSGVGSFMSKKKNILSESAVRPTVFCPCPRRLGSLTIISEGDWLGNPANTKDENNGAVVYVGSSLTVHNPLFSVHKL